MLALSCASAGLAQNVSVLLLDVRTGQPIPNKPVRIQFHVNGSPDLHTLEANTAADGAAWFRIPMGTLRQLAVSVGTLYPCFNIFPNDLNAILRLGVVSRCSRPPQGCRCKFSEKAYGVRAVPGQIVVFARPFTLSERFLPHVWE